MITTIVIVGIALYWLTLETDYFRVRLTGKLVHSAEPMILPQLDYQPDYDGSDIDYIPDYDTQLDEAVKDAEYQACLDELHAGEYTRKMLPSYEQRLNSKWNYIDSPLYQHRIRPMYQNAQGGIK